MTTLAQLGLQTNYQDVERGHLALDKLAVNAVRAQKAAEGLAGASVKQAAAQKQVSTATAEQTKMVLAAIQAEQRAEAIRLKAQITDEGRKQSLARLAQLGRDALGITKQIVLAEQAATRGQDAYNRSLETYGQVAARGIQLQRQMAQSYQASLNSRLGVRDDFGGANRAEDIQAYAAAVDNLRAKFVPLFAASKQYEAVLEEINAAERQGVLLSHEAEAARARAAADMVEYSKSLDLAGRRNGVFGGSLSQLSFQLNDIVSGLMMGVSPGTILFQQGGQVFQIWQMNNNVFKELGTVLGRLITPTNLFTGALLASAGAIAFLYAEGIRKQKEMEAAVTGPGRAAGVTAGQLEQMAITASRSAGISIGAARMYAAEYAASGKLVGETIRDLTELTADYAATTRQDVEDARKELVASFSNLASGVDTLDRRLQAFSPSQREYIKNLVAQGQQNKAVQATIAAMTPTLVDHHDRLTQIGRAWERIKNMASEAADEIERALSGGSLEEQLQEAQARLARMQRMQVGPNGIGGLTGVRVEDVQAQLRNVERIQQEIDRARDRAEAGRKAAEARTIADTAHPFLTDITPGYADNKALVNQQRALEALRANDAAMKQSGFTLQDVETAQNAVNGALATYLTQSQRAAEQARIDLAAVRARTPAERAAVAAQQARLNMAGQVVTAEQRLAVVSAAANVARAQANYQIEFQGMALERNAAGIREVAEAWERGTYAVMVAQARQQAANENLQNGVDVETRARQLLNVSLAERLSSIEADIAASNRQTEAQRLVNEMVERGGVSYARASEALSESVALKELEEIRIGALAAGNMKLAESIQAVMDKRRAAFNQAQEERIRAQTNGLLNPNAGDIDNVVYLADRRRRGEIGARDFNAARAGVGLRQGVTALQGELGAANPFGVGARLAMQAAINATRDEESQRHKIIDDALQAGLVSAQEAADARVAIEQDATRKIQQAYTDLTTAQLDLGQRAFGSLADGLGDLLGKQSAAYRAMFTIQKGFAIAQATINMHRAISEALALPFPANIPAMAAAAAEGGSILSSIGAISGFRKGGYTGEGNVDDVAGVVHFREWVTRAEDTSGNVNTLKAMASGAKFDRDGFGGGVKVEVVHDGSTGVQVQQLSTTHVRIIAKQVLAEERGSIVGDAIAATAKIIPDAVAVANRRPRLRSSG